MDFNKVECVESKSQFAFQKHTQSSCRIRGKYHIPACARVDHLQTFQPKRNVSLHAKANEKSSFMVSKYERDLQMWKTILLLLNLKKF